MRLISNAHIFFVQCFVPFIIIIYTSVGQRQTALNSKEIFSFSFRKFVVYITFVFLEHFESLYYDKVRYSIDSVSQICNV